MISWLFGQVIQLVIITAVLHFTGLAKLNFGKQATISLPLDEVAELAKKNRDSKLKFQIEYLDRKIRAGFQKMADGRLRQTIWANSLFDYDSWSVGSLSGETIKKVVDDIEAGQKYFIVYWHYGNTEEDVRDYVTISPTGVQL